MGKANRERVQREMAAAMANAEAEDKKLLIINSSPEEDDILRIKILYQLIFKETGNRIDAMAYAQAMVGASKVMPKANPLSIEVKNYVNSAFVRMKIILTKVDQIGKFDEIYGKWIA